MQVNKKEEFVNLFAEFISLYPYTPEGLHYRSICKDQRQQVGYHFETILAADSGENVTELVRQKLLPVKGYSNDWQKGTHINIDPSITGYLKKLLQKFRWIHRSEWPLLAQEILRFIRRCQDDPSQLSAACSEFSTLPYSKGFEMATLTPILNALRPDDFLLINNIVRRVINYFANTSYSNKLINYPAINVTAKNLIEEFAEQIHQPGVPAMGSYDLFNMFCNWLITVRKYDFREPENLQVKEVKLPREYSLDKCAEETGYDTAELNRWVKAIERKGQAILYGSPGTGKTFIAEKLAHHLIGGGDGFSELVQFHPAYNYEDFIQGIRPQSQDGKLTYLMVPGRFLEFCKKAASYQGRCVLIVDEINRANLAEVFGELMYLLEYRDKEIPLAGGNTFRIPANVRIIGTMNAADRSIALVDNALRRRFAFIEIRPNYQILRQWHQKNTNFQVDGLIKILEQVNQAIADKNYEVGISFFLTNKLAEEIEDIGRMEIEPYLEEYLIDQMEKVDEFRWDKIKQQVIQ